MSEVCRSILTKRSESPYLGVWKLGGKLGGQGAGRMSPVSAELIQDGERSYSEAVKLVMMFDVKQV